MRSMVSLKSFSAPASCLNTHSKISMSLWCSTVVSERGSGSNQSSITLIAKRG